MEDEVKRVFEKQRARRWQIALSGAGERIARLEKLRDAILARRHELARAIYDDFRKAEAEVDVTEVFPTVSEINHTIKHLRGWMKPHRVGTPWALFGTRGEVRYEAKGVVLVLAPWNYPFNLAVTPMISAIAAGNCVVLKPSSKVPHTAHFLKILMADLFPEDEVAVFEGGHEVSDALLELPFDHIFFTGSPNIGKHVMAAAAKNLAPVTLELGGKSPVIVDETADVRMAAERIMWGKFINAGQTCVAPDYLLIAESRQADFIEECKRVLAARYGATEDARQASPDYCRLVSRGHLDGLKAILDASVKQGAKIELGGTERGDERYLSPTLLSGVHADTEIMKEEIFGPILPMLTFKDLDEAIAAIRKREKPLALYLFSSSDSAIERVLHGTTAGGTCVNTLVVHLANPNVPFGGVGNSGMGNYHGLYGFRTFSHERAVVRQGPIDVLHFFYPPYTPFVRKLIDWATRYLSRV